MFGTNEVLGKVTSDGMSLLVREVFYTIQGEGPFAGEPSVFIRLGGCNLRCTFCFGERPGRHKPKVSMSAGPKKFLKNVIVGDKLLTYDEEFNLVETCVTKTHKRFVDVWLRITIDGVQYFVTPEHPFMTLKGIMLASSLSVGDSIYEVAPNDVIAFKKLGDKNPMKEAAVVSKRVKATDYVAVGKKVSRTIREKQKKGTYKSTWNLMTARQRKEVKLKISAANSGDRNGNYLGEVENFKQLKKDIKAGLCSCAACPSKRYLEPHHLDGDHDNDSHKNLVVLCKSCHTKVHLKGYNFWNGSRRDKKQLKDALAHNGKTVQEIKKFDRTLYPPSTTPKPLEVFNVTCSPHNTFLLDNMWVHNCDTDFDAEKSKQMSVQDIVSKVHDLFPYSGGTYNRLVVITGGEPLRQNIIPLIVSILNSGDRVQIETAGTLWVDGLEEFVTEVPFSTPVTIVVSPKTHTVHKNIIKYADSWKYVVSATDDSLLGIPITNTQPTSARASVLGIPDNNKFPNLVWVSPMDQGDPVKNKSNTDEAVRRCLKFGYRLSLQQHKIINVP